MLGISKCTYAIFVLAVVLPVAMIGCGGAAASPTTIAPTAAPAANVPPTAAAPTSMPATAAPAVSAQTDATTAPSNPTQPTASGANANETVTLAVVPEKSEARYRVREQLAGVSLPSDAIGKTNAISGQIVGKMDGSIVPADSKFVVDVTTLRSDQGMRDGFIQRTPLQTSQYPNVTFVPTSAPGLPLIVPDSGSASFQLVGDLTIRDVTKPVTWQATCKVESNRTDGTCSATTTFTFEDFNLEQPRVGRVLSIDDKITLEIDLALQRVNP